MISTFDQTPDRTEWPTMKWHTDSLGDIFGNREAVPLWVADMDFRAPDAVIEALEGRAAHGVYGYAFHPQRYHEALRAWYAARQGWEIDTEQIEQVPGVLSAIAILIDQHSEPGDGVILQPPVFGEFQMIVRSNNRKRVKNPLKLVDGRYEIDFEDLRAKAADPANKVMILCSPHNPLGRVWTAAELRQVVDICHENDVLLIVDEIHGDIVYEPHTFTPVLSLADAPLDHVAACLSPAKTFNIPGVVDAFAVIPNKDIRDQLHAFAHNFQINKTNVFALAALEAAYREGGPWLDDLLTYLQGNIDYVRGYLAENVPGVALIEPQGTYLVWLDFTALEMGAKELAAFVWEKAGLAVSAGHWFGGEGAGFARMNIACPRATLEQAMTQLAAAVQGRDG